MTLPDNLTPSGAAASLLRARQSLLAKSQLGEDEAKLVARVIADFVAEPSSARDRLLRQESIRARNAALRRLADQFADASARARARRILAIAQRYEAGAWLHDRHSIARPDYLTGTPEGFVWEALRAWPRLPGLRQLMEILHA